MKSEIGTYQVVENSRCDGRNNSPWIVSTGITIALHDGEGYTERLELAKVTLQLGAVAQVLETGVILGEMDEVLGLAHWNGRLVGGASHNSTVGACVDGEGARGVW